MKLRRAALADLSALAALEALCLPADPWSEESLRGQLLSPDCPTYVAELNGDIAGYVTGRLLSPEAELYRIVTHPDHRRRGVGRALLSAFLGRAQSAGCDRCFLEVRASNTAAQALYRSAGFEQTGVRRNYYRAPREDAVIYLRSSRGISHADIRL